MDRSNIVNILKEIKQILDDSGVTFWLRRGTCLGAIRENGFIPWDYDIDLGTVIGFQEFPEKSLNQIIIAFRNNGFAVKIERRRYGLYIPLTKLSITTDWCCYKIINDCIEEYPRLIFPVSLFTQLKEIDFIGERFYVPNPPEEYLRLAYGENWRVPQKKGWENDALNAMPEASLLGDWGRRVLSMVPDVVKRIYVKSVTLVKKVKRR